MRRLLLAGACLLIVCLGGDSRLRAAHATAAADVSPVRSVPVRPSSSTCQPGFLYDDAVPTLGPGACGCQARQPAPCCSGCPAAAMCGLCCPWAVCGRPLLTPAPTVPVGYHNHPRFFPVPTRPVFSPRVIPMMCPVPTPVAAEQTPADSGAPQIHISPPPPVPEEIRTPAPEEIYGPTSSPKKEDRVTSVPPADRAASHPSGAILQQPTPTQPDDVQNDPQTAPKSQAKWIRRY
jgi:hypothetical protein